MKLNLVDVLEYYDIPQLFLAQDNDKNNYLCLLYSDVNADIQYIGINISKNFLKKYINGKIDLRKLFIMDSNNKFIINIHNNDILANPLEGEIKEDMLPLSGFYNKK